MFELLVVTSTDQAAHVHTLSHAWYNAPVNGMPQYPPPAPSRGILGDMTIIISIAPGPLGAIIIQLKSNSLFSTYSVSWRNIGDLIAFMLLLLYMT